MVYVIQVTVTACQQTCMTYSIGVCTVKNSWWWTEELSETCGVLFQKEIWKISASGWFYYKNLSRCTITWMSNSLIRFTHTHIIYKTPDDGQRNCPKHVQFYSKNEIEEISASGWFYYKNLSRRTVTWTSNMVLSSIIHNLSHLTQTPGFLSAVGEDSNS